MRFIFEGMVTVSSVEFSINAAGAVDTIIEKANAIADNPPIIRWNNPLPLFLFIKHSPF
jgi:hypothetical protein